MIIDRVTRRLTKVENACLWSAARLVARRKIRSFPRPYKLHVGCGTLRFEGWINLDRDYHQPAVDVVWDATRRFPFPGDSCALIYNEHFLEHLPVEAGVGFLKECHRMLEPGGTLRVAMPSLARIITEYNDNSWRDQDWVKTFKMDFIKTRAEMINIGFRWWGHEWIYDEEELHRRLVEAGFRDPRPAPWGASDVKELCGRESRKESLLIFEARK